MKLSFLAKIMAFVVAAMITIPTVTVEAANAPKKTKTTKVRDRSRTEKFNQMVNKNTTTKSTTKKSKSRNTTNFSTNSYSTSTSTSTRSNTDNTNRKIFLKNQIIDWKAKLAKAEKSYQECIASGEDTPEKIRVVESKRKTVDECLEMIRSYEAELTSLK